MKKWRRRIRAAFGMASSGEWHGLVPGSYWRGCGFYSDLPFALLFAPLGFVAGIIVSGILVGIVSRRGFERTSLTRVAG